MPKNLLNEAKRLLPKSDYIGFSITQGNKYRNKSCSIYKFISLANKCLIKKKTPVFFIEKNQEQIIEKIKSQVPGELFPETNSELSCPALVTALSSRLDQAVSIDNGVMHMMALSNISMIVLFGDGLNTYGQFAQHFFPLVIGGMVMGVLSWLVSFAFAYWAVVSWRQHRARRMAAKRQMRENTEQL